MDVTTTTVPSFIAVIVILGLVALAITGLMDWLFPLTQNFSASSCPHRNRTPWEPDSSTGDESDYQSRCTLCATVLRDPPNA
jgi:hypothetical protein